MGIVALVSIPTLAAADDSATPAAADTAPPSAVEDFAYPNADKILAERGVKLIKGDGNILLGECDGSAQQIKVIARHNQSVCFQASGTTGYITLELDEVFYIETASHPITADLTADGETQTVNVAEGGFKSVGEGVGGAPTVLVEIRVTG
ncbi:hypothetical protein [Streptomyces sp. NPDC008125]|uniref:hypothetical protein n=1 Tax=Streptomyces sp. NPDC008125 TaxID=3364811 RepID=UPI0036EEE605